MVLSFPTRKCASEFGSVMSDSRVRFTADSRRSASVASSSRSEPSSAVPPSALMMVSSFLTLRYGQRVMPCSRHRCFKTVTHNPSCVVAFSFFQCVMYGSSVSFGFVASGVGGKRNKKKKGLKPREGNLGGNCQPSTRFDG